MNNNEGNWMKADIIVTEKMREQILVWRFSGNTGLSSKAIAQRITGFDQVQRNYSNYPHDPADLYRCILFLEAVDYSRDLLHWMREISPIWSALISNWGMLATSLRSEVGDWKESPSKEAPKTLGLMQDVIKTAQKKHEKRKMEDPRGKQQICKCGHKWVPHVKRCTNNPIRCPKCRHKLGD